VALFGGSLLVGLGVAVAARRSILESYLVWRLDRAAPAEAPAIVERLVELGSPAAAPHVVEAFERDGADQRWRRQRLAVGISGIDVEWPHGEAWERFRPAALARRLGAPAVPGLVHLLASENRRVRSAASRTLVEIGAEAVPGLVDELARSDQRAGEVAYVLARIGPASRSAVTALVKLADSDHWSRSFALFALGRIGCFDGPVRRTVRTRQLDSSDRVRSMVELVGSRLRVATGVATDPFDRFRARLLFEDANRRNMALHFLIGQFRTARDWMNPHRTEAFEGEIFRCLFGGSDSFIPQLAESWAIVLHELGCDVSDADRSQLHAIIAEYKLLRCDSVEEWEPPFECVDAFREFLRDMRQLLGPDDFAKLAAFLRDIHLAPTPAAPPA